MVVGCVPEDTLETTGGISGRVTEAGSKQPLANAVVDVSGVGQSYVTGDDGAYLFRQLPEGEYHVTASKPGYSTVKKQFFVRAGQTNTGDFALQATHAGLELSTKLLDFGMETDVMTFDIIKGENTAALDWKITLQSNAQWVNIRETSGRLTTPRTTITVHIDREQLTGDDLYSTEVIVSSKSGGAETLRITAMRKGAMIVAEPTALDFGTAEVKRGLIVKNENNTGSITYKATSTVSWCTLAGAEGTLAKNGVATIKVNVSRSNLAAGNYTGEVLITSSRNSLTIPVSMTVVAKSAPEVSNMQTSEVRHNSVNASAFISSVGSAAVTAHGFCWSQTNTQPTTSDSKNSLGGTTATKAFNATITGLTPNTLYYLRAYAINAEGVAYSSPVQVKTLAPPTRPDVKTTKLGKVEHNSVEVNGQILDLGDGFVTSHGFCYSKTNSEPTTADGVLDLGSTTTKGGFDGTIKGLSPENTYHVRAFAKNSVGTSYGGSLKFTTKVAPPAVVDGLLAYYTFDQQNCDDELGEEDFHGIEQGTGAEMSFVKDTPAGKGFALKGSNKGKYFKLIRAPEARQTTRSYAMWVKTKATQTIFYKSTRRDFNYAQNTLGIVDSNVTDSRIGGYYVFDTNVSNLLCNGTWHHLTVVNKGGRCKLYIDGRYYDTKNDNVGNDINNIEIGFLGDFDGLLDNLRIYNRDLTHDEIRELYNLKQ